MLKGCEDDRRQYLTVRAIAVPVSIRAYLIENALAERKVIWTQEFTLWNSTQHPSEALYVIAERWTLYAFRQGSLLTKTYGTGAEVVALPSPKGNHIG